MMEKFDDEIMSSITPGDVYWEFDGEKNFKEELALSILLMNEVVFLNSFWWKYHLISDKRDADNKFTFDVDPKARWTESESKAISVSVNCNDVFAWGCADAERLNYEDIQDLYDHWIKDQYWGAAIWCIKRRKLMPQKPVADSIKRGGIWDLDSMGLEANPFG